jgi:hypothetical protein
MQTPKLSTCLASGGAFVLLLACAKSDTETAQGGDESAGLSAAQLAGKWNVRAVPFSGDTTPTMSVLTATSNNDGWTLTFPNRPPIETRVRFDGDSAMTDTGPYESVRRKGVQVTTNAVLRLDGDSLVGISVARYATRGVDSVMRFRVTATRAP